MYPYILCFQIICILVSGICLYLAVTEKGLMDKKYGVPALSVFSGIFLMEVSYGLYLQATAMAGVQMAEKVCFLGKLFAAVCFFVTCVSLTDKDRRAVKIAAGILGLTVAVFLFSDSLGRFLYIKQTFLQNQYFYYIETELTILGELFCTGVRCLPLLGVLWLEFGKKGKDLPEKVFLAAVLMLWAISAICRKLTFLRHYDADMPLGAAFAVCLMIFVAWDTKKVYTGQCRLAEGRAGTERTETRDII